MKEDSVTKNNSPTRYIHAVKTYCNFIFLDALTDMA
jgi:hypothetical protein